MNDFSRSNTSATKDTHGIGYSHSVSIPYLDLSKRTIDKNVLNNIPENIARKYLIVPIEEKGNTLTVSMIDPEDQEAIELIKKRTGKKQLGFEDEKKKSVEKKWSGEPCNKCSSCAEIASGESLDVIEIDAASNRGIEEIRELRDKVKFAPVKSHYKVFIIDEVHMLTKEAFNALLKTLEEPPAHAVFILATTEAHKVPATIVSRCQRYDFRRAQNEEQISRLKQVVDGEKIKLHDEVYVLIAQLAEGSYRDALSLLDQVVSVAGEGEITLEEAREILNLLKNARAKTSMSPSAPKTI